MRFLLSEDIQRLFANDYGIFPNDNHHNFPANNALFEKYFAEALALAKEDKDAGTQKEEALWTLRRILEHAQPEFTGYEAVFNILEEETEAFLAGDRTAKETARVIQSRVQLYLDENKR